MDLVKRYDRIAPKWSGLISELGFPAAYRSLATQAPHVSTGLICDVGSGSGALSQAYIMAKGTNAQFTLLDQSKPMLQQAQKALRLHGHEAVAECCDLAEFVPAQLFDLTLCAHVIEHCPNAANALADVARITRPGGHVILSVSKPHLCQWVIWLRWQHRWFSADQMKGMGQRAGLKLVSIVPYQTGVPARVSQGYIFEKPKGAIHDRCHR